MCIASSVTSIGERAFDDCSSLTSITIGDGVTSIGEGAFIGCNSLTSVTIGDGVTSIGEGAFIGCNSLTSITIPDSVTSIGSSAFSCRSLISVTIGEKVTSIGYSAFYGCYKLIEVYNRSNLTITAGYSSNGGVAEYAKNVYTPTSGASKLTTDSDGFILYADDSASEYYLMGYVGNETEIALPDSIPGHNYEIYKHAFEYYRSLTSITIGDGVTSIGDYAFGVCDSLTSITIPDGVTSIGRSAFSNCSSLTSITIPESVTSIGERAFRFCDSLTRIDFSGTVEQWQAITKGSWWNDGTPSTLTIYCMDGSIAKDGTVTYYDAE